MMIFTEFKNKIDALITELDKGNSNFVIDKNLDILPKNSWRWRILCLWKPFYAFFNQDVYSHVRVHTIVTTILKHSTSHKTEITLTFVNQINEKILNYLDKKTGQKYDTAIHEAQTKLNYLVNRQQLKTYEWKWPIKGIDQEQQKTINTIFNEIYSLPSSHVEAHEKQIKLFVDNILVNTFEVPIKIDFIKRKDTQLLHPIILTKKVIAEGGQRKVKLCHDVKLGTDLVRKKWCSEEEKKFIDLYPQVAIPGINPVVGCRNEQFFELLQEQSLEACFSQIVALKMEDKFDLIKDLLQGLHYIHQLLDGKGFHFDIAPGNILISQLNGKWKAYLTDFGLFANLETKGGTPGYRTPQDILFYQKLPDLDDIKQHNRTQGQKRDMWAMGLIMACILVGCSEALKIYNYCIPAVLAIENKSLQAILDKKHPDEYFGLLQQKDIDLEIKNIKKNKMPIESQLWDLVLNMLQINPDDRCSASQALDRLLNKIVSK